jgi:urease accessory protein
MSRQEAGHDRERVVRGIAIMLGSILIVSPAFAHGGSVSGGLMGGLSHPLFGADHIAAMVAVGLWGAFLGPPAMFTLPVAFPLVMAMSGVLGILGMPLPGVEIGIAVSAAILGMMVRQHRHQMHRQQQRGHTSRPRNISPAMAMPPPAARTTIRPVGQRDSSPKAADAVAYSAGFVVATGLLHLAGIGWGC